MTTAVDESSPAANYGCLVGRTSCPACRPAPAPCAEFEGLDGDHWCPKCGWARWAHRQGSAEAVRCQWCSNVTTLDELGMLSAHEDTTNDGLPMQCAGASGDDYEAPDASGDPMTHTASPAGGPSDWLLEFTTDPVMRNEMLIELGAVYDYNENGYPRPDMDDLIGDVLSVVASDIRDRANDQAECNKVDDCTTKTIVLRHLANMLAPAKEHQQAR